MNVRTIGQDLWSWVGTQSIKFMLCGRIHRQLRFVGVALRGHPLR